MTRPTVYAVLLAMLSAAPALAQGREFTRTVDLEAGGMLRVEGTKGSMRIASWDRPQVEIRARIEPPARVTAEYAQRAVEATGIEVIGGGRSLSVASNYDNVPSRNRWGSWDDRAVPPVHFEIRAPRNLNLVVDSDRGPVTVSGFTGSLDAVVDRGELDVRDVSGDVRIEIDRGDRSRLQGIRGSLVLEADRTDVRIDAEGLERDSRIEVDRGDIDLRVPEGQRLTVRTDISRRGHFYTDLPIEWSSSDPRRSEGRINGGGAELRLESDRARVELRRRN